jgi:hypothetical protein
LLVLAGCSSLYEPAPKVTDLGVDQIISHTASLSGTIIVTPKDQRYFCAQPAPDAGFTQGESGGVTVAILASQSESATESEQSADVEMMGRTPGILLARELLYRLCEFGHNNALDKREATALYKLNLSIIEKISGIEAGNTNITIGETLTNTDSITNVGESGSAANGTPALAPPTATPAQSISQPVQNSPPFDPDTAASNGSGSAVCSISDPNYPNC